MNKLIVLILILSVSSCTSNYKTTNPDLDKGEKIPGYTYKRTIREKKDFFRRHFGATHQDWERHKQELGKQFLAKIKRKEEANKRMSERERAINISTGTGFVVSREGTILTSFHVVKNKSKIQVQCNDKNWHTAKVSAFSRGNDIALLSSNMTNRTWIPVIPSDTAQLGDEVYTIGFPVVELLGAEPKYTNGVLSSKSGFKGDKSLMQVTTAVQPGNSGGPLVLNGKGVVGIVTSTAAISAFYGSTKSLPQNINWSTKSDYVDLLDKSILKPPRLNLSIQEVVDSVCLIKAEAQ